MGGPGFVRAIYGKSTKCLHTPFINGRDKARPSRKQPHYFVNCSKTRNLPRKLGGTRFRASTEQKLPFPLPQTYSNGPSNPQTFSR